MTEHVFEIEGKLFEDWTISHFYVLNKSIFLTCHGYLKQVQANKKEF